MEEKLIMEDEAIIEEVLENGLKVYIHPKNKFVQSLASLQVNFGGRDYKYQIADQDYTLPEGTAHFLEHMLFENNGNTLSDFFIKNNADINAFTSRRITSYYFSTQNNFDALLASLLDNFIDYDFSEKTIKKERNIISQELAMSDDSDEEKAYKSLLRLMYKDRSIYQDIGGSKTSIKSINKAVLNQAVTHFYHPQNMSLLITGNVNPIKVLELLKNHPFNTKKWQTYQPIKRMIDISDKSGRHFKKIKPNLDTNIVEIGVKIPEIVFRDKTLEHNLLTSPFFSLVFGNSSLLYRILKSKNLYNYSFSAAPVIEDDYGFFNISIETKKPKLFIKTLMEYLTNLPELILDEKVFKAYQRGEIGRSIKAFDDVKKTHYLVKKMLMDEVDIFSFVEKSKSIKLPDLQIYLDIFKKNNIYLVEYLQQP